MKTTTEATKMYNPPHAGEVLKGLWVEPLGMTQSQVAEALGVSRKTVSALLNGRIGVSPDMAMRIAIAFRTEPSLWLGFQAKYDEWQIEKRRTELEKVVKVVHWDEAA